MVYTGVRHFEIPATTNPWPLRGTYHSVQPVPPPKELCTCKKGKVSGFLGLIVRVILEVLVCKKAKLGVMLRVYSHTGGKPELVQAQLYVHASNLA